MGAKFSIASVSAVCAVCLFGAAPAAGLTILSVNSDSVYGTPTNLGDEVEFNPTSFIQSSSGGDAGTTSGTVAMTVRADTGTIDRLKVFEEGDYALTGTGGSAATAASVTGTLFITDVSPGVNGTIGPSSYPELDFYQQYTFSDSGSWSGSIDIDLSSLGIVIASLSFQNVLQTTSETGTAATISKSYVSIGAPEPGTLCLLAIGGAVTLLARRRR